MLKTIIIESIYAKKLIKKLFLNKKKCPKCFNSFSLEKEVTKLYMIFITA